MDELALPFDDEPTFSVGELNGAIADALARGLPAQVWVRGEVSQLHTSANGHSYFDLVEKEGRRDDVRAVLRVALFRNDRASVSRALRDAGVRFTDGIEVRIRGRVDYYPPQGRLQLVMSAIDPVFTVGRMAADRVQLLRRLAEEGVLRANAAHELTLVPLRVGLVTSGGSAAYHDFVHELEVSGYAFRVAHCDVRVQGAAAQRRIAYALRRLGTMDLDVVVVVRGGGSRSDLAAFDTEIVARAIAAMPMPVLTGIGHEVDRTVADEVAHTVAKTPTAAAGVLVDRVGEFDARLGRVAQRVAARARSSCGMAAHRLAHSATRVRRAAPAVVRREEQRLRNRRRRVVELARAGTRDGERVLATRAVRLAPAARRRTRDADRALVAVEARLRALDPRRVLERGYSITRTADGGVVRRTADAVVGGMLVTEVADGTVSSRVEAT